VCTKCECRHIPVVEDVALQRKQPLVRFIAQQCGSGRRKPRRVAPADRDQGALAEEYTRGGETDA
jgi:hypothetical protein